MLRPVFYRPASIPTDPAATTLFEAVTLGVTEANVRPLNQLHLALESPDEFPIISAVYTDESRQQMKQLMQSGLPYGTIDQTWFPDRNPAGAPILRGTHFRVVAGGLQPHTLVNLKPDLQRYRALNLPPVSKTWLNRKNGKILVLTQSARFGEIFGVKPYDIEDWVYNAIPAHRHGEIKIRPRHDTSGESDTEALNSARVVVGFNSAMLIWALAMGIPAIGHRKGSVVHAFNGLKARCIDTHALTRKSREEVEDFLALLATYYQASTEELATPGFIMKMMQTQLNI